MFLISKIFYRIMIFNLKLLIFYLSMYKLYPLNNKASASQNTGVSAQNIKNKYDKHTYKIVDELDLLPIDNLLFLMLV